MGAERRFIIIIIILVKHLVHTNVKVVGPLRD